MMPGGTTRDAMTTLTCPICGQPFDSEFTPAMPFCSVRCQQVDLGRWIDEKYALPHEADDDEPDEHFDGR
jgi:endogenous inhibitor of DNA gyrase (YacG/DUF329 family)